MPVRDPPRLLDAGADMPNALREGLKAARSDLPRGDQLARLASRLPMGGAPPPAQPPPSPPQATGASPQGGGVPAAPLGPAASVLPAAGIGALVAIGALGIHALLMRSAPPSIPARDSVALTAIAAPSAAVAGRGHADPEGRDRADLDGPSLSATAAPSLPLPAIPVTGGASSGGSTAAPIDSDPAPELGGGSETEIAAGSETEIELLQRAQDALRAAPAQALALTARHSARFPRGSLGQEREVIAIDALVRLGRTVEARARAAAFVARFPTSAHVPRIDALVPAADGSRPPRYVPKK